MGQKHRDLFFLPPVTLRIVVFEGFGWVFSGLLQMVLVWKKGIGWGPVGFLVSCGWFWLENGGGYLVP